MTPPTETSQSTHLADRLQLLDRLAADRGIVLERDVSLAPLTTLRVGGPADRLATPRTVDDLLAAVDVARDAGLAAGVLGKGSDIVVSDRGIRGLVVRNRADDIRIDGMVVRAESGASMAALVKRCTAAGLTGLEFGISIPGSMGGAVWANAGAHGGEMKDIVVSVEAWSDAGPLTIPIEGCAFEYRSSIFKVRGDLTVLAATIHLSRGEPAEISERVAGYQAHRRATQPVADQNAGSVFRNPPGDHAGRLIDAAGLKGIRVGSAAVSTLHANFIVVDRGGRADDVRRLGDHVRTVVADRSGVELEYEIEFVGDWDAAGGWGTPSSDLQGGAA
ncbi:MAG: UDP-N-acetylmuramate dehydrogenase [Candidatus Limnocylindria bacterium]